jgi:glucose-6-phosphate 1-dehydrogenase
MPVPGYCEEEGVPEGSTTPTYAAIEWYIDNWRWQGVPFYVRSGKRMPLRATEVSIHFKRPPHLLFGALEDPAMRANVLTIRVQPDEGISLQILSKLPGQGLVRQLVTMDFNYSTAFGMAAPPAAYERLLLDAMLGDATLFARSDEIELAWGIVDPILEGWELPEAAPVEAYVAGTWGPDGAALLIEDDTRRWCDL